MQPHTTHISGPRCLKLIYLDSLLLPALFRVKLESASNHVYWNAEMPRMLESFLKILWVVHLTRRLCKFAMDSVLRPNDALFN